MIKDNELSLGESTRTYAATRTLSYHARAIACIRRSAQHPLMPRIVDETVRGWPFQEQLSFYSQWIGTLHIA